METQQKKVLGPIINALATPEQLKASQTRGLSWPSIVALHHLGGSLIQLAGSILALPISTIATATILFHRFHLVVSFYEHSIRDTAAACLFIASKVCEFPLRPGITLGAINTAAQDPLAIGGSKVQKEDGTNLGTQTLYTTELQILTTLAFDTHVVTPYTLCVEYLNSMRIEEARKKTIAQRAWNYVNDSLNTRICILHQPNTIAVTALWLAGRELDIELLDGERWWTAFDVNTEDMGHIFLLLREGRDTAIKERDRVVSGEEPGLTVQDVLKRLKQESS
ncbi:cyclin-like protein [Lipomyces arxii]|uniref:cyclin-like protein n=1 Tax=Lipomyces arxii TaxID=56418 RepID=UPI0034CFCB41